MLIRPLLLPLLLLPLGAVSVQAQGAPNLDLAIEELSAATPVREVLYGDLDRDGVEEALVLTEQGCGVGACEWHLVGSGAPDGWGVLASGSGIRTGLVETHPDGHVIRTDGVILAWDGARLTPYHDLLATMGAPRTAHGSEARLLNRVTGGAHRAMEVQMHETDPYLDGQVWRVAVLPETSPDGERPFHLIAPDQSLALSGVSIERPWLYQDIVEGEIVLRVVSVTGTGFIVETLQ